MHAGSLFIDLVGSGKLSFWFADSHVLCSVMAVKERYSSLPLFFFSLRQNLTSSPTLALIPPAPASLSAEIGDRLLHLKAPLLRPPASLLSQEAHIVTHLTLIIS